MKLAFLVLVSISGQFSLVKSDGCKLDLKNDLPQNNDPVYLMKNYLGQLVLAYPDGGSINLRKEQELVLACTGNKNSLAINGKAVTDTKCSSGTSLKVGSIGSKSSRDLNCVSKSSASLLITNQKCVDRRSVIIQLGFQAGTDWQPLVDVCHNIDEAATHWSRHTLYGSKLDGKARAAENNYFEKGNDRLYKGFNPLIELTYSKKNEENVFTEIYKTAASRYINQRSTQFLARGHLAPAADFLFTTWRMMTYFYVNVAPQWQSINGGKWRSVEENARKLAIKLAADLQVVTGTHGVLSLEDDRGFMRQAYLSENPNRLPVPELFWKLIYNPTTNACIVLISTNNPYIRSPPQTICRDICRYTGWPVLQTDLPKGYVYCCDYQSFKAAVPQVPKNDCRTTLNFNP